MVITLDLRDALGKSLHGVSIEKFPLPTRAASAS